MSSLSISLSLRRLLPAVFVVGSVAACGPLRRGPAQPPATIIFTNESLDQAAVYVVAPGRDFRRIGTVFAGRTDTLRVPADLALRAGTLNIVARLLARPMLAQTGPVALRPGGQYRVRLPTDARLLSFLPAGP